MQLYTGPAPFTSSYPNETSPLQFPDFFYWSPLAIMHNIDALRYKHDVSTSVPQPTHCVHADLGAFVSVSCVCPYAEKSPPHSCNPSDDLQKKERAHSVSRHDEQSKTGHSLQRTATKRKNGHASRLIWGDAGWPTWRKTPPDDTHTQL